MSSHEPTDRQMRTIVQRVAHLYLEVERGLRPPEHLRNMLDARTYAELRREPLQTRHPEAGPVVPRDIARIQIDRNTPHQVTASVTTREFEDRWGGLVIHLREKNDGWLVDEIERIQRRGLESAPEHAPPDQTTIDERIRSIDIERRAVEAAHVAVTRRLREPEHPATSSHEELIEQQNRWRDRLDDIDVELRQLRQRQRFQREPDPHPDLSPSAAMTERVTQRLSRILGTPPEDRERRVAWMKAYEEVVGFRDRWDISDDKTLLGPEPAYDGQRRDRDRVADIIQDARTQLRQDAQQRHARPLPRGGIDRLASR